MLLDVEALDARTYETFFRDAASRDASDGIEPISSVDPGVPGPPSG